MSLTMAIMRSKCTVTKCHVTVSMVSSREFVGTWHSTGCDPSTLVKQFLRNKTSGHTSRLHVGAHHLALAAQIMSNIQTNCKLNGFITYDGRIAAHSAVLCCPARCLGKTCNALEVEESVVHFPICTLTVTYCCLLLTDAPYR